MPNRKRTATKLSIVQPANETKHDKFLRLAAPRVQRVLNSLRLVGNLASPNYMWSVEDTRKMKAAIAEQLTRTFVLFEKKEDRARKPVFHFEQF